jgi:hypothetical protein
MFGSVSSNYYKVEGINGNTITISPELQVGDDLSKDEQVYLATPAYNSIAEIEKQGGTAISTNDLKHTLMTIANSDEYFHMESSIPFVDSSNSKLKFISKNPGAWGNEIKVAVANHSDFASGTAEAFPGILLNSLFQYAPESDQIAVVVAYNDEIVEQYIVSLTPGAKDYNNKSLYIEDVVNRQSLYIYIKDNTSITGLPASKLGSNAVALGLGTDGSPSKADVIDAYYTHFGNKEEIDIDYSLLLVA